MGDCFLNTLPLLINHLAEPYEKSCVTFDHRPRYWYIMKKAREQIGS